MNRNLEDEDYCQQLPRVGGKNAALFTASLLRSDVSRNLTSRIGTTMINPVRKVFSI